MDMVWKFENIGTTGDMITLCIEKLNGLAIYGRRNL